MKGLYFLSVHLSEIAAGNPFLILVPGLVLFFSLGFGLKVMYGEYVKDTDTNRIGFKYGITVTLVMLMIFGFGLYRKDLTVNYSKEQTVHSTSISGDYMLDSKSYKGSGVMVQLNDLLTVTDVVERYNQRIAMQIGDSTMKELWENKQVSSIEYQGGDETLDNYVCNFVGGGGFILQVNKDDKISAATLCFPQKIIEGRAQHKICEYVSYELLNSLVNAGVDRKVFVSCMENVWGENACWGFYSINAKRIFYLKRDTSKLSAGKGYIIYVNGYAI